MKLNIIIDIFKKNIKLSGKFKEIDKYLKIKKGQTNPLTLSDSKKV